MIFKKKLFIKKFKIKIFLFILSFNLNKLNCEENFFDLSKKFINFIVSGIGNNPVLCGRLLAIWDPITSWALNKYFPKTGSGDLKKILEEYSKAMKTNDPNNYAGSIVDLDIRKIIQAALTKYGPINQVDEIINQLKLLSPKNEKKIAGITISTPENFGRNIVKKGLTYMKYTFILLSLISYKKDED
jgi:hypothetical protein